MKDTQLLKSESAASPNNYVKGRLARLLKTVNLVIVVARLIMCHLSVD